MILMLIHGKPEHSDGFSAFHFVSFDELVFRLQTPCAYSLIVMLCPPASFQAMSNAYWIN